METITMDTLLDRILRMDAKEIFLVLDAVRERFSELFPDQELLILSVPGDSPGLQITELQKAAALLATLKEK